MCLGFIDVVFRVLVEVLKILSSSREIGILGERDGTWHTKDVSLLVRAFYWYSETALLLN